jgi:hypothetical protein
MPLAVFFILILLVIICVLQTQRPQPVACTEEALICPDGTGVGRVPPDCRFAPCPDCTCPDAYIPEGSTCNPKCYYQEPRCLVASIECNYTIAVK